MTFKEVIKKVFKIFSIVSTITFILSLVIGALVYFDGQKFNEGFQSKEKIFLLNDEGITIGVSLADATNPDTISYFSEDQLTSLTNLNVNQDYNTMLQDSWKLLVVDISMLKDAGSVETSPEQFLTNEQALKLLRSDDPNMVLYNSIYGEIEESQIERSPNQELKGSIFLIMLNQVLRNDPVTFYKAIKNEKIIIYPETILFKVIKIVPDKALDKVSQIKRGE